MVGAPVIPANLPSPLQGTVPAPNSEKIIEPPFPGAYKWDHPLWWTIPHNPIRRPGSLLSLDETRLIANRYDIIRTCINHLIFETVSTGMVWKPKVDGDTSARTLAQIQSMTDFCGTAGGLGGEGITRTAFEYAIFEDLAVLGCTAVWLPVTRGGQPLEAIDIDAATIRPRVNSFGWAPPGDYQYEQWVYGVIQGQYRRDDMVYSGLYKTTRSPYFSTPIEWLLQQIQMAVGYDTWNSAWLKDGNTVDTYIEAPETWTPQMLYTYTNYLDRLLSGDLSERQKVKLLAPGTKMIRGGTKKEMEFISGEQWLARRCSALWGVHLSTLGFEGDEYAANGANASRNTTSFGTGRFLMWRKEFYDDIALRRGCDMVHCVNQQDDLAALAQLATIDSTYLNAGAITPNEVRGRSLQLPPYEDNEEAEAGDRLYLNTTMSPIEDVASAAERQQEQAKLAAAAKPQAGAGAPNRPGAGKVRNNARANSDREKSNTRK